jgi:predicted RecA/RadA family phage recombinase
MAQNYVSRGEVISLTAGATYTSGLPYNVSGFNGVALISVVSGEQLSLQVAGIFEFTLASVTAGALIYITSANALTLTSTNNILFGRAVTASNASNKFELLLIPSVAVFGS